MCFRRLLFTFQNSSLANTLRLFYQTNAPVRSPKHIKNNIQFFFLFFSCLQTLPSNMFSTYYLFSKQKKFCILCYHPGTLYHMSRTRHILETNTNPIYAPGIHNIFYRCSVRYHFSLQTLVCADFDVESVCVFKCPRNIYRLSTIGDIAYVARTCKVSRL